MIAFFCVLAEKWLSSKIRSLAVTKRPCDCCVGQFWRNVTGRWYFRTL